MVDSGNFLGLDGKELPVKENIATLWMRNDFRLNHNLDLLKAAEFSNLLRVYVWGENDKNQWRPGGANLWIVARKPKIYEALFLGGLVLVLSMVVCL